MKTKKFLFAFVLVAVIIFALIPNVTKAATSEVTLESVAVTSKAGTYKTGDTITIVATYTDKIFGDASIRIKFGNSGELKTLKGKIQESKVTYEYEVTKKDSGILTLKSNTSSLEDSEGNSITNITPELKGNTIKVNPLTWTDVTNCKILLTNGENIHNYGYKVKIEGLDLKQENQYYCFITTTKKQPELVLDSMGFVTNSTSALLDIQMDKYLEINEDIYYWICEQQKNYDTGKMEQKFIIEAMKIERPKQNELGNRIIGHFSSNKTNTYLYAPHNGDIIRNVNVKIGKVTDNSILLSIKNGEADSLSKLLTYAKETNSIYKTSVKLGDSPTITDKFDITDKAYYYVYMELDDENGRYYPVEDVSLYQGFVNETFGKNLHDYLSANFKWNISNPTPEQEKPTTKPEDKTTATGTIPQTGETAIIFIIATILIAGGIFAVVEIKKNNF